MSHRQAPEAWFIHRGNAGALRKRPGFTLIELMVVVVLIGILSAIIIPEMRGSYGDALLRSSARELIDVCHLAYSRAVSVNQLHVIRFQSATGRYQIERQLSRQGRAEFVPLKDVTNSSGRLDNRIHLEVRKTEESDSGNTEPTAEVSSRQSNEADVRGGQDAISFYPDGTADAAELVLRDAAGFGLRLRIDPVTARVQIIEFPKR